MSGTGFSKGQADGRNGLPAVKGNMGYSEWQNYQKGHQSTSK